MEERAGDWIQTYTGRQFWPLSPRVEDIDVLDIAHALSNLCRFGGHCLQFYSVAQHSVLVSQTCERMAPEVPGAALWGLLHDASEAYLADVPRPVKPYLTGYEKLETQLLQTMAQRFGLPWPIPEIVKRIDSALLADEMVQLMITPPADWDLPEPGLGIVFDPMTSMEAERGFLKRFEELFPEMHQAW